MRITEYLQTQGLNDDDLFLTDGAGGTKALTFATLAALLKNKNEIKTPSEFYDWLDNIGIPVEVRKTIYRGKNLGNTLTKEQAKSIADGSFKGLFLGDYWNGPKIDERDGATSNNTGMYAIYDFDYWYRKGNYGEDVRNHHLTIFPTNYVWIMTNLNVTNTSNGYISLDVHTRLQSTFPKILSESFLQDDDILTRPTNLSNSASSSKATSSILVTDVKAVLPTICMFFDGARPNEYDRGADMEKLALISIDGYAYSRDSGFNATIFRDIANTTGLYTLNGDGLRFAIFSLTSTNMAIRPVFGITGEATAS